MGDNAENDVLSNGREHWPAIQYNCPILCRLKFDYKSEVNAYLKMLIISLPSVQDVDAALLFKGIQRAVHIDCSAPYHF